MNSCCGWLKAGGVVGVLIASTAVFIGMGPGKTEPSPAPPAPNTPETKPDAKPTTPTSVLDTTATRIDGTSENLSIYKGKVVLIVNVASKCGLTGQYKALQSLYDAKKDDGLVILGFPANDFASQEPGSNSDIKAFCESKFGVTFPMFEKISVKGDGAHPLYKALAALPAPLGGEPKWNFTKFLVDRSGAVVARFEPRTKPDDPAMVKAIDSLLKPKAE
jgi:glutathione peroxidase